MRSCRECSLERLLAILISALVISCVIVRSSPPPCISREMLLSLPRLEPMRRVQDQNLFDASLASMSARTCVRDLVGLLDDPSPARAGVIDFWTETTVGDLAFIVLVDLFTLPDGESSTLSDASWESMLAPIDTTLSAEEQLRAFDARFGRAELRRRWQAILDARIDRLVWDSSAKVIRTK